MPSPEGGAIARRDLLSALMAAGAVASFAGSSVAARAMMAGAAPTARPSGISAGVQLYMMKDLLAENFEAGMAAIAATGVREVEFAGFYGHDAESLREIMAAGHLAPVSAHCIRPGMTDDELTAMIGFGKTLGLQYLCAAAPEIPKLVYPVTSMEQAFRAVQQLTLDDFHRSARRFNEIGKRIRAAGLQFIYHTHGFDFRRYGETVAFDVMLAECAPEYVAFELDIGNAIEGGADPVAYLEKYPKRFLLAHLKDWKNLDTVSAIGLPPSAPFGSGVIRWQKMIAACHKAGIRHYFLEQEGIPAADAIASLKQGIAYFASL